ncbi:MAG: hypothetical protein K8I27_14540 [Planctomycetes bacterium]|nr:hypothetical protein [Planctomycetota bacterium]
MTSDVQAIIEQIRTLAARGDYAAARRRILELTSGSGGMIESDLRGELDKQGRTLEVLESIDVVRRLLRKGDTGAAAQASSTILDALSSDEYARLGVVAAALTLIGRAAELARSAEHRAGDNTVEVEAFVDYLGHELNQLGRDSVDRPLEILLDPTFAARGGYTLGDLLSRRPWAPNIRPALDAVPETRQETTRTSAISAPMGDSPVIGRILIEQEERERVSTAPQTRTDGASAQSDAFDIVGRAALQNWWVVLASMMVFAFIGYAAMTAAPDRWQSTALLQKTQTSKLRAPITGETSEYVPSLPHKTVLELVKLPVFHLRVSERLKTDGWAPGENPAPADIGKYDISADKVGKSLSVTVTETSRDDYLIEFRAETDDATEAQAIAGAAAAEFREVHYEHVTREATLNLGDYEARATRLREDLRKVYEQRMSEFATGDMEAIGVDIESRTRSLVVEIKQARDEYEGAKIELRAARDALDSRVRTAERLPEYELPQQDARVAARRAFQEQMERELYDLARKRDDFGAKHPVQERIRELQEDIELVKAEIRELERGSPDDIDQRKLNPDRARAEDLVTAARSRLSIAQDTVSYLEKQIPKLEGELEGLRTDYLKSETLRREEVDLLRSKERTDVVIEELNAVKAGANRDLALISPAGEARKLERETMVGIAVGLILGLVVGIGIAVGLMRRRQVRAASAA